MSARRLLERAYLLADQNKIEDAKHVLNAIVFKYPNNLETWEFYLQLCTNKNELDWMAARISESKRIDSDNKREILNYYRFLKKSVPLSLFDVKEFVISLWNSINPALKVALPLLLIAFLLKEMQIIKSLFSALIAIELVIFIFAWKAPKEISPLSGIRKFAQESKFFINWKKDKATEK